MVLIVAGFALLLLPLSLAPYASKGWAAAHIITMLVLGVFLLACFFMWERKFASTPLVPWHFLRDRTILGAASVAGILFLSFR